MTTKVEQETGTTEVAKSSTTALQKVDYTSMVKAFRKKNQEFDLDMVDLGIRLTIDPKGRFQNKDDENDVHDSMAVVILSGAAKFNLWGEDGTPDEGTLLITADTLEEAENAFDELSAGENGEVFGQIYSKSDISQRYIITFAADDGNLYAIDMSKSSRFSFTNYVKMLFTSKSLGVSEVITKLTTEGRKKGKNTWNVVVFTFVEVLDACKQ